ncbi:MAG: XRE family transcriptional regulator [Candidatus Eremiobacteraeota bacterium]|nr:XRE family transcriptional regulator [Candidatus Eremiobacteraeota bacterium]
MSAIEARKKRGGTTLLERTMRDPGRAARIEELTKAADIEQIVQSIMAAQHISAAELARRLDAKPPQISRDLHGGLRKATLARLVMIAEALGYDFVPALVPRNKPAQRDRFFEAYRALIPRSAEAAGETANRLASTAKKPQTASRRRKCA